MWESAHILCTHTLGIECNLLCAWTYVNLIALCVIGRLLWGCVKDNLRGSTVGSSPPCETGVDRSRIILLYS